MPNGKAGGKLPGHNKSAKKAVKELDEDDKAFQDKQRADAKAKQAAKEAISGKKGPLKMGPQGIKK